MMKVLTYLNIVAIDDIYICIHTYIYIHIYVVVSLAISLGIDGIV